MMGLNKNQAIALSCFYALKDLGFTDKQILDGILNHIKEFENLSDKVKKKIYKKFKDKEVTYERIFLL